MTEENFQWFIDVVEYLQFLAGDKLRPREYQTDKIYVTKVNTTKDQ